VTTLQLKSCLRQLVKRHFPAYDVRWANVKYVKPEPPCIILKLGHVSMATHSVVQTVDGAERKSYASTAMLEINLYSPGLPEQMETGAVQYQNTACDELTGFCISLDYPATHNIIFGWGIQMLLENRVFDITAILDGVEPEYRAMAEFKIDFTQTVTDPYAQEEQATEDIDATGWFDDVGITDESEDYPWQTP